MENEPKFIIFAPEGYEFGECAKCTYPFLYNGTSHNCIACDLNINELIQASENSRSDEL